MTTKTKFVCWLAVMASLAVIPGCWTYSLHPLYEANDPHRLYDPELEGKWETGDSDCAACILAITGDAPSLSYTFEFVDPSKKKCDCATDDSPVPRYEGRVLQLGPGRFLDATPIGDAAGQGYMAAHNLFKIKVDRHSLLLMPASDDWLCANAKPEIGECIEGDFIFTSQTSVLQDFIQAHAGDDGLFPKPNPGDGLRRVEETGGSK
jgi:hypothetical protein